MTEPITRTSETATEALLNTADKPDISTTVRYSSRDDWMLTESEATLTPEKGNPDRGTFEWFALDQPEPRRLSVAVQRVRPKEWESLDATEVNGKNLNLRVFELKREKALAGLFLEVASGLRGRVEDEPVGIWESDDDPGQTDDKKGR